MTLRELLSALSGHPEEVMDSEVRICFHVNDHLYYNEPIDKLGVAAETNYIGSLGVITESDLANDLIKQQVEHALGDIETCESTNDYDVYIPKNTLIIFAKSQF